ncbi:hypothetical protein TPHA_0H00990 [Tetrapisispora phaffii CBS 4417]|uniref:Small ribosomal subunit protein mS33 n=1 Tax=Tetrapisispora phaffii (strain ATCC 24235 / CBS 4417 / NBRC 1672 / NRRL Y-8282 / UCD 70-5) TaxID=1071381 RepID=G8BX03_TETPH|nr:mitochondrial 37S ribosomal protein RSM27 TPHA_0H00990 [Tetrapisispora phaffii CBS 4417]CCE64307.1 hypothetical protein TPHA_0H00990 [Tetrapisispora phaffii CBS 4417]
MSVSRGKLQKVAELSAKIFDQVYNPTNVRTGNKILSKRLKGPSIKQYYGNPDVLKFKHMKTLYPDMKFTDPDEEYRLSMVELRKRRGKGTPAKAKAPSDKKKKK